MNLEIDNTILGKERGHFYSMAEVSALCELSQGETEELIDFGALKSEERSEGEIYFSTQSLELLQAACKQRRDYDLDLFSVVISVQYLENIADLKKTIQSLRNS